MDREIRCPCHALARWVPLESQGYRAHGWVCHFCKRYARADQETQELLEGMAHKGLHEQRERLKQTFFHSPLTQEDLRAELRRKPWEMKIDFFDEQTVQQSFTFLQKHREIAGNALCLGKTASGRQCRREATEGPFCWQHSPVES